MVSGDTLTALAQQYFGNNDWQPIQQANQHIISDPNLIFVGQVLLYRATSDIGDRFEYDARPGSAGPQSH